MVRGPISESPNYHPTLIRDEDIQLSGLSFLRVYGVGSMGVSLARVETKVHSSKSLTIEQAITRGVGELSLFRGGGGGNPKIMRTQNLPLLDDRALHAAVT